MNTNALRRTFVIRSSIAIAIVVAVIGVPLVADPADGSETTSSVSSIVPRQSPWAYSAGEPAPPSGWQTADLDWPVGAAPFGRGRDLGPVNTVIPSSSTALPLSMYFVTDFTLTDDLPEYSWLNTWADDGIVVWVNGVEVGRKNAPAGPVSDSSYATRAPWSASARTDPVTFTVPVSVLHEGRNTIAVQVLANWRRTPNLSFDAHLVREDRVAVAAPAPPPVPVAPTEPAPVKPLDPAPVDPGTIAGWGAPTWRDEFTYTDPQSGDAAVDPANWNVRGRNDLGLLFDAAVVSPDQVSVDDAGLLHIRGDWLSDVQRRPSGRNGPAALWHQTGYLDQRDLVDGDVSMGQQYGRWEIRAKTPTGDNTRGALAAFWLRNAQSGEIDIMEAWGHGGAMPAEYDRWIKDTAVTTVHTETDGTGRKRQWRHAEQGSDVVPWDGFHIYAFELAPTYAAAYVDGVEVMRETPRTYPDLWDPRYFGTPLHMRLNLHVGPSAEHWGLPDPAHRALTQNLDFQVDYVRVWEYDGQ